MQTLHTYAQQHLLRKHVCVQERDDVYIQIEQQKLLNFSSNDYLGVANHRNVKYSLIEGISRYGFGSSASALVSGYYAPQKLLEERFAQFLQRERALYVSSGYLASLNAVGTLIKRHDRIFADKECHASLLDGIQLSRARCYRYDHNNIEVLQQRLEEQATTENKNWIISEGVFSMSGDISCLPQMVTLREHYHASIILDDAHGIGVLGKNGRGTIEHYDIDTQAIDCLVTPLGKAFGASGAMISGPEDLVENIIQFSPRYRCTTAAPPALSMGLLTALTLIENESWRRDKLQSLIKTFIAAAKERALPLMNDAPTPVKTFLINDNLRCIRLQESLNEVGFYVGCMRPPSVPHGTARLRITLNCHHTENDIIRLLDHLETLLCSTADLK